MKFIVQFVITGFFIFIPIGLTHAIEVKVPVISEFSELDVYKIDLLKFILEKAGVKYKITSASQIRTQARIILELKHNSDKINLHWMGTSRELENDLLPIRIPIYRGLLGHRIFIIHKGHQAKFDNVKTLSDLQKLTGTQGLGWTDIEILEHSGLKQYTKLYENIFRTVNIGRVDYFSRGLSEAFVEVDARIEKYPNLDVENKVLLVYPFAMFFFTSHSNTELAGVLEDGFRKSYEDGSFNTFFYNHPDIKEIFKQAHIDERIRIDIPNPLLSVATTNIQDKYWHRR
jgi:hypothetical protein